MNVKEYAKKLEKMDSKEFTKVISNFSIIDQLNLAMSRTPISVYQGKDMSNGEFFTQKINYEKLAEILLRKNNHA